MLGITLALFPSLEYNPIYTQQEALFSGPSHQGNMYKIALVIFVVHFVKPQLKRPEL